MRGGVRVTAGIDLDPACRFAYESNNATVFHERDVRNLSGADLAKLFGDGDFRLLAGCAPCQSFSSYGRMGRHGRRDEMWNLLTEFGRLVRELGPDLVTMENVPQLKDHTVFDEFLSNLSGYCVVHEVVDCARYRIPQTRKRLVLLASRIGSVELVSNQGWQEAAVTVRTAISGLRSLAAGETDPNDLLHTACRLSDLNLRRIRASKPGGTWRDWDKSLVSGCHRKGSGSTFPGVYGRMNWDEPSPTITTQCFGYGNGRFGHPEQDRAITLREAATLQTFPPQYSFLAAGERPKFSVLGRLIGNAVPVRLGEVIAESLLRHVETVDASRSNRVEHPGFSGAG